jgi:hypothetical protein
MEHRLRKTPWRAEFPPPIPQQDLSSPALRACTPLGKKSPINEISSIRLRSKSTGTISAMSYLILKAALSGIIVLAASEFARRSPGLGGLVASLPLVSILAMIWLWQDTADRERVAAQSAATFWFVLPSLPMFLALPAMLRQGLAFWPALALSCFLTMGLYALTIWALSRFGVQL